MNEKKPNNTVFYISLALSAFIAIWAIAFNESFTAVSGAAFNFLTVNFAWLYMVAMTFFVVFALYIAFSKWGKIRLGPDDSRPEHKTVSWFAMLFGAGMGVGLVFWGVAEPLAHYAGPAAGIEPGTVEAAEFAMKSSFMHWGIHPWANYSIIGLALAYFQFRKNKPGLISTALEPLIGEKGVKGWLGKLVDILAVFATVAGVVTSLGLGVLQINSGLNYLFGVPITLMIQIIIIGIITVIYVWSAVSGIDKGIKLISDMNLNIALVLMVVAVIVGPKLEIVNSLMTGMGQYLNDFMVDTLKVSPFGDNGWVHAWRVFYWAWWIAWAPFVGIFIARISKGRTIREFILGVVFAPSIGSIIWFAIFGTLGLSLGNKGVLTVEAIKEMATETRLFYVINKYPLGMIISVVAIVLLTTFFITSANSGTFVLSMLTSEGDLNPPHSKIILWGVIQAVLSVGLLMAGGLDPLQTISIVAAFPFIFIMIATSVAIIKALKEEDI